MVRPLLAPAGSAMAYAYMAEGDKSNLAFASADGMPTRPFPLVGDSLDAFAWDSYGLWLAVHLSVRSEYSGRIIDGLNYLVSSKDFSTRQLPSTLLLNPLVLWSPDESSLALLGTDWMETHYAIRFYEVGLDTGRIFDLTTHLNLASDNYLFITNGAWMGSP